MMVMVLFFCRRSDCPLLRSQKEADPTRMTSTFQSGTRRTERTNKPSAGVADLRTEICVRFLKTTKQARAKCNQARTATSAINMQNNSSESDAQHVLIARYTSQRPARRAFPLVQIELWVNCSKQTRHSTCATRMFNKLAQKLGAENRWSATLSTSMCKGLAPHKPLLPQWKLLPKCICPQANVALTLGFVPQQHHSAVLRSSVSWDETLCVENKWHATPLS